MRFVFGHFRRTVDTAIEPKVEFDGPVPVIFLRCRARSRIVCQSSALSRTFLLTLICSLEEGFFPSLNCSVGSTRLRVYSAR